MKLLVLTMIITLSAYANEPQWYMQGFDVKTQPSIEACKQISDDNSQKTRVDNRCFYTAIQLSPRHLVDGDAEGTLKIVALENSLYIAEKESQENGFDVKRRVVAGAKTTLKNIRSIDLSDDKKYIMVLDGDAIKVFRVKSNGNIGPFKMIKHPIIKEMSHARFSFDGEEALFVSSEKLKAGRVSLKYDSRIPKNKNKNSAKIVYGEQTMMESPVDVASFKATEFLYVLDSRVKKVLVFSKNHKGNVKPKKLLESNNITSPVRLILIEEKGNVVVENQDGSIVTFEK